MAPLPLFWTLLATAVAPALAQQYGVEAIPNVFVLKSDGTKVGSVLGYGDLATFMADMNGLINSL